MGIFKNANPTELITEPKNGEDKDKGDKIGGVRKAMLIQGVRNVLHISPCKISCI